jgi:trk system potassium uptake protein TrkH
MLYREISKILGYYFLGFALILMAPLALSIYYEDFADLSYHPQPHSTLAFLYTILVCLVGALFFFYLGRNATAVLYRREGIFVVVLFWVLTPALSALPFVFSGTLHRFDQAFFESVSGFTTTGLTVLEGKKFDPETNKEIPIRRTIPGVINTTYEFYGTISPARDPVTGEILY